MNSGTKQRLTCMLALAIVTAVAAGCGGGGGGDGGGPASQPVVVAPGAPNIVSTWYGIAASTVNVPAAATGTPEEQRPILVVDMATVHVAIYDAVMAITGTHQPFAAVPAMPGAGASVDAAVSSAAYNVLKVLFPNRSAQYQAAYDAEIAKVPAGDAKTRGIALGADVAARILALRANDGRAVALAPYVPGTAPGKFRGVNPINRFLPSVKPLAMTSAAQFRAPGPPALTSTVYANDVNETKAMAATGSTARSAEQTEIARFHTENPGLFQTRNYLQFATSQPTVADNARLMAQVWVTTADATIACFETKYHFEFWRPTSAINLADTDGNPGTDPDTGWTPHVATPNHPEYPAAHSCVNASLAEAIARFFGTRSVTFSMDSTVTSTTHVYQSVEHLVSESAVARIWGGMHFRTSTQDGVVLGRGVANWVADRHFRPRT